jgi:hypothetical protein
MIRLLVTAAVLLLLPGRALATCSDCINNCCNQNTSLCGSNCTNSMNGSLCIAACSDLCNECLAGKTKRITISAFDTTADLKRNARAIAISGPFQCDSGGEFTVEISISQQGTGAVAHGLTHGTCTGDEQGFSAVAHAHAAAPFTGGTAQACGLAVVTSHGAPTDAVQWCREIQLQ